MDFLGKPYRRFWLTLPLLLAAISGLAVWGFVRLKISVDILAMMPDPEPGLADMRPFLQEHPLARRIFVDIGGDNADKGAILATANQIQKSLKKKKLAFFPEPNIQQVAALEVSQHVITQLPAFFDSRSLQQVYSRLTKPANLIKRLNWVRRELAGLRGPQISQHFSRDPLGLADTVFARFEGLKPSSAGHYESGILFSADGKHGLIIGEVARNANNEAIASTLEKISASSKNVQINAVGAFRSARDNERTARADVKRISIAATVGLILILVMAFRRSPLGLAALLAPLFGVSMAIFIFSLFRQSIHALTLGFGGAIISIAIDHAMGFVTYLQARQPCTGHDAARALWKVGGIANATTVVAFGMLIFSGFPLLVEIGIFAAIGNATAFAFLHLVYPRVFHKPLTTTTRETTKRFRLKPIRPVIALGTMIIMAALGLWFHPPIRVDLAAINTVSDDTLKAESTLGKRWGFDQFSKAILVNADTPSQLLDRTNQVAALMGEMATKDRLRPHYDFRSLFPSPQVAARNQQNWQDFWTPQRSMSTRRSFEAAASKAGFSPAAFDSFWKSLNKPAAYQPPTIDLLRNLGVATGASIALPFRGGSKYSAGQIHQQLTKRTPFAVVLDANYYADSLGSQLGNIFFKMSALVSAFIFLLLLFFFRKLSPVLLAFMPIAFAAGVTSVVLRLLDLPIGLSSVMLAVVVLGNGIDYALYTIRAHQAESTGGSLTEPFFRSVSLSALTTLIGYGTLFFADHRLMQESALTICLGIGFSYFGAAFLLPGFLKAAKSYSTKGIFFRLLSSPLAAALYPIAAAFIWLVTLGHWILQRQRRQHCEKFYGALFPDSSAKSTSRLVWRQYFAFSAIYLDRLRYRAGSPFKSERTGWPFVEAQLEKKEGALFLMSHVGNWDAAALSIAKEDLSLMIYLGARTNETLDHDMHRFLQEKGVQLVISDDSRVDPLTAVTGYRALKAGSFVAMTGDRVWSAQQSSIHVACLGKSVHLPKAPFAMAWNAQVPILPFFSIRVAPLEYQEIIREPIVFSSFDKAAKDKQIAAAVNAYVEVLLDIARTYPDQWHHFEAFLSEKETNQ